MTKKIRDLMELREEICRIEKLVDELLREEMEPFEVFQKREFSRTSQVEDLTEKKEREQRIVRLLREIGIPASLLGYEYIKKAVILALEDESYLRAVTKELYPKLAKNFNTNPPRVERSIRHAIERVFEKGNINRLNEIFSYTVDSLKGRPTNREFLATIVEELKRT